MANSVGNILGDNHVRKSFHALLVDALPDADLGGLGLGVHTGKRSLNHGHSNGQSYKNKHKLSTWNNVGTISNAWESVSFCSVDPFKFKNVPRGPLKCVKAVVLNLGSLIIGIFGPFYLQINIFN